MTAYTPGPWSAYVDDFGIAHGSVTYVPVGDDYRTVAYVIANGFGGELPFEANARLIASAPDLLGAAVAADADAVLIEDDAPSYSVPKRKWEALRAAIAKAMGDAQ